MILSKIDIERIIEQNPDFSKIEDIIFVNDDGFFQLKNKDFHCIFYDIKTKKCMIYNYRPMGCRFYPLLYDLDNRECQIDKECPYWNKFYMKRKNIKRDCKKLKEFIKIEINLE
jgi:hypothetical protein